MNLVVVRWGIYFLAWIVSARGRATRHKAPGDRGGVSSIKVCDFQRQAKGRHPWPLLHSSLMSFALGESTKNEPGYEIFGTE